MMKRLAFALLSLLIALPALASSKDHLTGTSLPSGYTGVTAGIGVICMNGAIVAGSGGACPGAVTGESFANAVTAASADAAILYRTAPVSFTTSKIFWFSMLHLNSTSVGYIYLHEGVPTIEANSAHFGGTGSVLFRVAPGNSGANIVIDRYLNDAGRTRTSWGSAGAAWATPAAGIHASTVVPNSYSIIGIEIDGPNRRWRVHTIGQQLGTPADTPLSGHFQNGLTDWVNFTFHEGGATYCNTDPDGGGPELPQCGNTYLTWGDPLNDAVAGTTTLEFIDEDDGATLDGWLNGRVAGGGWDIYRYYAYPDGNGVPARWVMEDRATQAVANGAGGAWDEVTVKDPYVMRDGATYHMCFSGSNAAGKFQLGCATAASPSGAWTKNPNNPLVVLSAATDHDQVFNPRLVKDEAEPDANKRWKLIYIGADTSAPIKFRVFVRTCAQAPNHASCDTAAEWSAATELLGPGTAGAIDDLGWGRVEIVESGGVKYLFGGVYFNGNPRGQETYATFGDRWLSAGTKSGVIVNGAGSSDCNTTTTAAVTTPGSRTLTVASTTGCAAGHLVVLDDDGTSANFRHNLILRVASATSLVLYHNEDSLASGARVRGANAFHRVDTGPVRAYAGGYYKLSTCYDPFGDLTPTIDAYSEKVCAWTGPSILGPFTLYPEGSPIAPLNNFGRTASNENLSLVNLPFAAPTGGIPGTVSPGTKPEAALRTKPIAIP